ncbi:unnamed protein product [Prunus brigantina]
MGNRVLGFGVLLLVMWYGVSVAVGYTGDPDEDLRREKEEREGRQEKKDWTEGPESGDTRRPEYEKPESEKEDWYLLPHSRQVVKTEAGEMSVVMRAGGRVVDKPMHIGFITMEPKSLFIPQYLDSNLFLFVRRGEAKVGLIYRDELGERRLKSGDVYRIPAGSPFYLVNTGEGQRLHIICSLDTSESLGLGSSFFIGGGINPQSVLAGFDHDILTNAFNVSSSELMEVLTSQQKGPIVYLSDSHSPNLWSKFLQLKEQDRLQEMKKMVDFQQEPDHHQDQTQTWSWRKLLNSVFGAGSDDNKKRAEDYDKGKGKAPDSYNLYDRKPDFRNNYGWSMELDESDYAPLKDSGVGVYLVNLTAGAMMAPHVNPTATEYGIVLRGSGTIQIVFPNGTSAMNTNVQDGDVFWVPRYFPFCQIASRTGPLEFFGFTTSARKNRPQFLAGASSVLQTIRGPELAAAFGVSEDRLRKFINAQREAVILPSAQAAPPYKEDRQQPREGDEKQQPREGDERKQPKGDDRGTFERVPEVIKSFGTDMVMGFD